MQGSERVNKGTVLVVDDDQSLLDLLASYLTRLGYDVEACASGNEALGHFQQRPMRYVLVVTDARLPDLSGQDLVLGMAGVKADLRVVICSGIPVGPVPLPPGFSGRVEFLQKPFRASELARALETALAGS
jgi:FixJ family two-component response regulator